MGMSFLYEDPPLAKQRPSNNPIPSLCIYVDLPSALRADGPITPREQRSVSFYFFCFFFLSLDRLSPR